jgi:3-deoxy-D-manno-octulosonic-acid transferase
MFLVYEVLLYLVLLAALPWFLLTGVLRGKYLANLPQRLGHYRHAAREHDLWIHAVSVGEAMAAKPVVDLVRARRPETSIVITTTTVTGQTQARRLFADVTITYFPFDFAFAVRRFLRHHRPRAFVTMETEIWPNTIRICREQNISMLLANGRISDRSFPRYRAVRALLAPLLRHYERILVREQTDLDRFVAMGAPAERVEVVGNVKFDYEPDDTPLEIGTMLERLIGGRPVLILGSTMEGEPEAFLPELEALLSRRRAFVIIAPRKPQRFEMVAGLLATSSLRFVRRSEIERAGAADVLLLDTLGELARLYRYATVAFIGGTLTPRGGHNPIEAAAVGVPVCFGPSMSNFREIAEQFVRNGAARQLESAAAVVAFAAELFDDAAMARELGTRARETVERNRGASARTAERILEILH